MTRQTTNPVFGLRGVTGKRIVSIAPGWKPFSYPAPDNYASPEAREAFVKDLQNLRMYDPNRAVTASSNGQGIERDLIDLTDEEFERLLRILGNYCAGASANKA